MEEIWKDIKDYEGLYQVSNLGRVKSLRYDRIMKLRTDYRGYLDVLISVKSKTKRYKVHRLVAEAFIPNPNNLPQVNHIDENKQNNNLTNLEWCTNEYNNHYGTVYKRRIKTRIKNMEEGYNKSRRTKQSNYNLWTSRAISQFSLNKEFIKSYESMKDASKSLHIASQNISECCRGKRKTAGGYIWKYK